MSATVASTMSNGIGRDATEASWHTAVTKRTDHMAVREAMIAWKRHQLKARDGEEGRQCGG